MDHTTIRKLIAFNVSMCGLFFCSGIIFGAKKDVISTQCNVFRYYVNNGYALIAPDGTENEKIILDTSAEVLFKVKENRLVNKCFEVNNKYVARIDKETNQENVNSFFLVLEQQKVNNGWNDISGLQQRVAIDITEKQFNAVQNFPEQGRTPEVAIIVDSGSKSSYSIHTINRDMQLGAEWNQQASFEGSNNFIFYAGISFVAVMAALLFYVNNGFGVK